MVSKILTYIRKKKKRCYYKKLVLNNCSEFNTKTQVLSNFEGVHMKKMVQETFNE